VLSDRWSGGKERFEAAAQSYGMRSQPRRSFYLVAVDDVCDSGFENRHRGIARRSAQCPQAVCYVVDWFKYLW